MMQRLWFAVAAVLVLTPVAALAQPADGEAPPMALRTLGEAMVKAIESKDTAALEKLLSNDYLAVDVFGQTHGKRERLKQLASSELKIDAVESTEQVIVAAGETAVISGIYSITGKLQDRDVSGKYRYVDTFARRNGQWVAIASTMTRVVDAQPAGAGAQADQEQAIRLSRQLWRNAIDAESRGEWAAAVGHYEAIKQTAGVRLAGGD
jgi:ketosteroid isomerase-like protein